MNRLLAAACGALLVPVGLTAQVRVRSTTAGFYENYRFGAPLKIRQVSEFTVPVGVSVQLGSFGELALSGGYARVDLTSADPDKLPDQQLSGPIDTEVRFTVNVIPGRLVVLATGAVPTGIKTVAVQELAILGALSSDLIGFAASNLGTGGSVGAGFAGAIPVGRFAIGLGATAKQPLGYTPVLRQPEELKPGKEMRFRVGVEGPLTRRTYLRAAGIFARTAKDRVAITDTTSGAVLDSTRHGVGNRIIGYLSVNHGIGPASVTLYGFDVFRGGPQVEPTALGTALLPRGNLIGVGGRVDVSLARTLAISPRAEYRISAQAPDTATRALQRLGESVRAGLDVRYQVHRAAALVLQGEGLRGHVIQGPDRVKVDGYRVAVHLELTP